MARERLTLHSNKTNNRLDRISVKCDWGGGGGGGSAAVNHTRSGRGVCAIIIMY